MEQRIRASRYPVSTLGDKTLISKLVDGPFGTQVKVGDYRASGIPLLRVSNCRENEVSDEKLVYIEPEHHARLLRSEVRPGDVVFTKTGHVLGYAAVFPDRHERANISSHLVLMRTTTRLLPEFLAAYLRTDAGQDQVYRWGQKATKPELNTIEIRQFLLPVPNPEEQLELLAALDTARIAQREKLGEADALLSDLDGFVLDALGLTLPASDGHRTAYAVHLRDARQRFDPDYNSPRFRTLRAKIEHGRFPAQSVGSLFYPIVSGFAAGSDDQTDDPDLGVPHIRPLNITSTAELIFKGTKMVPRSAVAPGDFLKKGEVLFNNTNSTAWVGKTVVFDVDRDCACSNHITRLILIDKRHNPYYFAALFNALRRLGFFGLLSTNFNNQAGINADTLKAIRLSVPDPKAQEKIATEVARRRDEARHLRDEARTIWDDAKRRFEEELLGPETNAEEPKTGGAKGGSKQ